jgi:hypothetical protein
MKKYFIILLPLSFINYAAGQVDSLWTKTFGGDGYDEGTSVQQTSDNGYIISGFTESFGNGSIDAWLIKTNTNGDTIWTKTFGGDGYDGATFVQQTSDSGYIFTGVINSNNNYPGWLGDIWLFKTDENGNQEWNHSFDFGDYDFPKYIEQTDDLGYLIVGSADSYGVQYPDILVIKTDENGTEEWHKIIGTEEDWESGYNGHETNDGGFIILGSKYSEPWLIKLNSQGDVEWQNIYETNYNDDWYGFDVITNSNGSYYIICQNLIKTDLLGNIIWMNENIKGGSIELTNDGNYAILDNYGYGNTGLVKIDYNGQIQWQNQDIIGINFEMNNDNSFAILKNYDSNILLIKTTSDETMESTSNVNIPVFFNFHQNYPNPFNPVTTLRYDLPEAAMVNITIYDMMGRIVKNLVSSQQNAGYKSIQWDATNNTGQPVSAGLYLYTIQAGQYQQTKKMVLLK